MSGFFRVVNSPYIKNALGTTWATFKGLETRQKYMVCGGIFGVWLIGPTITGSYTNYKLSQERKQFRLDIDEHTKRIAQLEAVIAEINK